MKIVIPLILVTIYLVLLIYFIHDKGIVYPTDGCYQVGLLREC